MSVKNANVSGKAGQYLQNVPGGPSVAAIAGLNEQTQAASAGNNYAVVEGGNQGSNEFPYQPFARDPYDNIANIKKVAVANAPGGMGGQLTVPFEKEDAEYLLRQRAQVENADYDRWVMQKYDLTDPAQNFLMQQIAPDQFQRRLDLIDYQQSLVSKYARIRLLGAKSSDDLKFEWLVETGRIQLPQGPIWDPKVWMSNQLKEDNGLADAADMSLRSDANRKRFMKGIFNPISYNDETSTGWQPNYANPADIRGQKDDPTVLQLFAGSGAVNPYTRYGSNPIAGDAFANQAPATVGVAFGSGYESGIGALGQARKGRQMLGAIDATKTAYLAGTKGYGRTAAAPWTAPP